MPPVFAQDASGPVGLVLGSVVLMAAAVLGRRQWIDHRGRPPGLTANDAAHFARQDVRRILGTTILAVVGLGLGVGGWLPDRVEGHANPVFIFLWVAISFLIVVLVALAMIDLLATRGYARRHRERLTQQGIVLAREEARLRAALRAAGERGDGPDDADFSP